MHDLTVRFWGTRGSVPVPGPHTARYGGNTTCLEIRYGDTIVIVDAGTGIRQLGNTNAWEASQSINLLLTHSHWDHIQGLPFFSPAYAGKNSIKVYGNDDPERLRQVMEGQMGVPYFPVPFGAVADNFDVERAPSDFSIGDILVRTQPLPHPGGCLGYRFEAGDSVFVVATDCELGYSGSPNGNDADLWHRDSDLARFFEGAQMIAIDCQYTDAEYEHRIGWGHNSIAAIIDVCRRANPESLVMCHHDPESDDDKVDSMVSCAKSRLSRCGHMGTIVTAAREQTLLSVRSSHLAMAM